jgi:hypothetical protein
VGVDMGIVVGFPEQGRAARDGRLIAGRPESATVIILPVIRIERYTDEPAADTASRSQRRRRRRRAARAKSNA